MQIDCVVKLIFGLRRYVISAVDYYGNFAFSFVYKTLSSASAADFLTKLTRVAPFEVKRVQTDNGSEFYKYFHAACEVAGMSIFGTTLDAPR